MLAPYDTAMQPFFTNIVASEPFNSFCVAHGSAS
jgi:hypothetical protein